MLQRIRIERFKSILDETVELGAFNVFIGANGSGKTNVLEAVAFAAGALAHRLSSEDLVVRGIRVSRPSLMTSAFQTGGAVQSGVNVALDFGTLDPGNLELAITAVDPGAPGRGWQVPGRRGAHQLDSPFLEALQALVAEGGLSAATPENVTGLPGFKQYALELLSARHLSDFAIYSAANEALRGVMALSAREPIGLHGENLDVAFASLPEADRERIRAELRAIDWVEDVTVDVDDAKKFHGHKLGRSTSRLYFTDQYLPAENNEFAAEVANEGVLHLLFYLTLVLHPSGPACFGIDNVETALNPGMCRRLAKVLAALSVERGRQILATTHNPAVLDGLNLHDDQQRLFVVSRDDEGHTRVRRVRVKPDAEPGLKLSELWLRGHLGALPEGF